MYTQEKDIGNQIGNLENIGTQSNYHIHVHTPVVPILRTQRKSDDKIFVVYG